jgi:chemotaxis receptor (MCP) glutamine deamidase CheD
MFGKAVFGDNTTIVVGNHNHQQITNTAAKNDKAVLAAELRKHGVGEEDIQAIHAALDEDPVPVVAGQYGPAVQGWMKRMLGRAVDASWNIPVGAAGNLLATLVQNYYGNS